ncbi:sodium-dependent transporter [Enteractinococcus coprophilus]|uniref:Transporter n=1 Tax=Enteractinococcus coprophilus TaxID=1027633 RepID=A0A543AM68_9MICC|nr:sodium-dependent transporter [Enteractinococcus coprophilus]TQL73658.1 NSS family neurotransmitter:Na+ symporter [Enteractinococcus coprophilus]
MSSQVTSAPTKSQVREDFGGRWIFILAAMGSAIGLGNIWRFPYIAYENGGGAFIIPYLVALLSAGIPLLFFDYALGHRFKGSPPLTFRRLHKRTEAVGWWHAMICVVIGIYYAAILAWSAMYIFFSATEAWGDDPNVFFFEEYLQAAETPALNFDLVPGVFWPLLVIWVATLLILAFGVRRGIGLASAIGIPLLVLMFLVLVVIALTLPGAFTGLDALFTPNWEALLNPSVWIAAYGQIFFSLSVGFGIMITYASYLKRRTNLTSSGMVVAFSNSGFEILAGIGVFSTLGFMAQAAGVQIGEVVTSGIGLAFVAFPEIISQAPLGLGPVIGILFFGSLLVAGFTSMISILEVTFSAIKDKTGWSRNAVVWGVGTLLALISLFGFGTTSGVYLLDTLDKFVNQFGIVAAAFVAVVVVAWLLRRLGRMVTHLNKVSSFRLGTIYKILVAIVLPVVLGYMLISEFINLITAEEPYEGYPGWYVNTFGWGMALGLIVIAVILSLIPWPQNSALYTEHSSNEYPLDESDPPVGKHASAQEPEQEVTP